MRHLAPLLAAVLLAAARPASAADAPKKAWTESAEASLVTTNGNTHTSTLSLRDRFGRSFGPKTSLDLDGGALRTKTDGALTAERFDASEKVARKWSDRDYGFEKYRWDRDRFAGIRHRHEFSVGAGREFWKTDKDLLTAEGGPSYVIEERIGERRRSFAASRLFASYGHDFSATVKFRQTAEWVASLKDKRDYRLATETGLTSALSTVFSVKTAFQWKHSGQPPPNAVKDDTTLSVALIASF
jgi:putative salt-induced outer membrane protein YdiY